MAVRLGTRDDSVPGRFPTAAARSRTPDADSRARPGRGLHPPRSTPTCGERFGAERTCRGSAGRRLAPRALATYEAAGARRGGGPARRLRATPATRSPGLAVEGLLERDAHEACRRSWRRGLRPRHAGASLARALPAASTGTRCSAPLPPLFAVETALRLLVTFGLVSEASLWIAPAAEPARVRRLDSATTSRRGGRAARGPDGTRLGYARPEPHAARRFRAVPVVRWGRLDAALVVRVVPRSPRSRRTFLCEAAAALSPLLERALLLERGAEREADARPGHRAAADPARLRPPRRPDPGRARCSPRTPSRLRDELARPRRRASSASASRAARRHDAAGSSSSTASCASSRTRLSRAARSAGRSRRCCTARSRRSRPARGIAADATRRRARAAFLSASQRITLFRAAQEALSNIREHSGAAQRVGRPALPARLDRAPRRRRRRAASRSSRASRRAAKRGRLGLIGINERVRMLGGTFHIDSAPGGPTVLTVTLPRWEPLDPAAE